MPKASWVPDSRSLILALATLKTQKGVSPSLFVEPCVDRKLVSVFNPWSANLVRGYLQILSALPIYMPFLSSASYFHLSDLRHFIQASGCQAMNIFHLLHVVWRTLSHCSTAELPISFHLLQVRKELPPSTNIWKSSRKPCIAAIC